MKMEKFDFCDWILENTRPNLFVEDAEGTLPFQLALQRKNLPFFRGVFERMGITALAKQSPNRPGKTPQKILLQEKLFQALAQCIALDFADGFRWLLKWIESNFPEWVDQGSRGFEELQGTSFGRKPAALLFFGHQRRGFGERYPESGHRWAN